MSWLFGKESDDIKSVYNIGKELGSGTFATVKEAVHKKLKDRVAIKIIDKNAIGKGSTEEGQLRNEVAILDKVNHPHIVKMHEIFNAKTKLYIVMEICEGGELFDRIVEKGHFSEKDACKCFKQLMQGISYLHSLGIAHRDLKPENLFFASKDDSSDIKVADFGLAKFFEDDQAMKTACGTPGYVAPEVLENKGYDKMVDCWSAGVILYIMLCGFPPFYDEHLPNLFRLIREARYDFPDPYWTNVSPAAKDLVKKLLVTDPKKRLTAEQTLEHPWVVGFDTLSTQPLSDDRMKAMRSWNRNRRLKKAALAVVFQEKLKKMASAFGDLTAAASES